MIKSSSVSMDIAEKMEFFRQALGFKGLNQSQVEEVAHLAFEKHFAKAGLGTHRTRG